MVRSAAPIGGVAGRLLAAVPVPLLLVTMTTLSGVALNRVYRGPLLIQLVLGAAAGAVVISCAMRRAPAWSVAPVSVLAMTGYVAWAVRFSAQRAAVPGDLLELASDALRNGIPRLLMAMIPVEPQPDTVVVPVIAAWLTALASAEVAIRANRMLLGYLPSAALYAAALYVVGPNAAPAVSATLAYAALAAAGLALTGRPGRSRFATGGSRHTDGAGTDGAGTDGGKPARDSGAHTALRLRLAAGTAASLAVVVAAGGLLGPIAAERVTNKPTDPRQYLRPPQLDALDENPLVRLSGWALSPEQHLFDLRLSGGTDSGTEADGTGTEGGDDSGVDKQNGSARAGKPGAAPARIRLAVLSDYDGVTWRVGAVYRNAGRALPPVSPVSETPVRTVQQEITVADLAGRLLPAAATPQLVDGVRVAYDRDSGTLIRPEGLRPGVRYTVRSSSQPLDVNLLPGADVPSGPTVARMLRLGDAVPEQIDRLARQLGADSGAPYDRAVAIEQFLAEHYRFVVDAPSGHAYPNLSFFLFGPRNAGGQRGTSEQFAAAFAVLARLLGMPTRVVVGFQAPAGGGPVRASDALAWPEVLFEGVGWVPFNPLPQPDSRPRPVEEDFRPKPETTTPPPSDAPTLSATPTPGPATSAAGAADSGGAMSGVLAAVVAGVTLVLVLVGYLVTVPLLLRARRRRLLGEPDPARRVAAAWLLMIDALRLAGRPVPTHLAATEVAAYADQVLHGMRDPDQATVAQASTTGTQTSTTGTDTARSTASTPDRSADGTPIGIVLAVRDAVPPLDGLADLVNVNAFGGTPPDPVRADEAQRQALEYVRELRARQPWWRRVLWSLHPGPLRWHR